MAIADKLTYLNETKSQIKTMINYGLETPLTNEPFRDYVSSIFKAFIQSLNNPDTLWNNLPKITGTGTNISLNNTIEAPMRITLSPSELTQDATPTPSSPQDIHTISGSNKIVVCGKNLFDKDNPNIYHKMSNAQLQISTDGNYISVSIPASEGLVYTLSSTSTLLDNFAKIFFTSESLSTATTALSMTQRSGGATSFSATAPTGTKYANFYLIYSTNQSNINSLLDTIQVEIGTATTYNPYISQEADIDLDTIEYCKIGNYEDKFIRTSGKNLFDGQLEQGGFDNTTGTKVVSTVNYRNINIIPVKPNTTFTFSINGVSQKYVVLYYDNNKTFISAKTDLTTGTFTTPNNCYYLNFRCFQADYTNDFATLKVMLNEGTTATEYEPYGSNEWYIKKNIGKVVLDGTETYSKVRNYVFSVELLGAVYPSNDNNLMNCLCNYYDRVSNQATWNNYDYMISYYSNNSRLAFRNKDTQEITDFQTWLSTHNTIVYYQLATPTYTKITGTLAEQLEAVKYSKDGQTNISQVNNDLPFGLSVSALEDLI